MFKDTLVELLKRHLEAKDDDTDPFGPRVSQCIGPQGQSVAMARDLCLRRNSCMVFTPRLTSTFSRTISGIDVQIVLILNRMYGSFRYKDGSVKPNAYFSDFALLFFGTSDDTIKAILEEIGVSHGVSVMWVRKYTHIETVFRPRPGGPKRKRPSPHKPKGKR